MSQHRTTRQGKHSWLQLMSNGHATDSGPSCVNLWDHHQTTGMHYFTDDCSTIASDSAHQRHPEPVPNTFPSLPPPWAHRSGALLVPGVMFRNRVVPLVCLKMGRQLSKTIISRAAQFAGAPAVYRTGHQMVRLECIEPCSISRPNTAQNVTLLGR